MKDGPHRGSCHCRAVAFEAEGALRGVVACHCSQCRKTSGHYWAASAVPLDRFVVTNGTGLAWYRSSGAAMRGFCRLCGSSLFWKPEGEDRISFAAGALDGPTGLRVAEHIFTEDAGDYYAAEGPPPEPTAVDGLLAASCLCGEARFTLPAPAGEISACHCDQCRKLSGHYTASFDVDEARVEWLSQSSVAEYETRHRGRRGFCTGCGSSLYFRMPDGRFSVEAGSIDGPTGGTLACHIFVAEKGDWYDIDDGLPQFKGWD